MTSRLSQVRFLALALTFLFASGCVRLSRTEFDAFPGTRTVDVTGGLRLRPTNRITIDLLGGQRMDANTFESHPVAQVGLTWRLKGLSLGGRVDYTLPDHVQGFAAMEFEF